MYGAIADCMHILTDRTCALMLVLRLSSVCRLYGMYCG